MSVDVYSPRKNPLHFLLLCPRRVGVVLHAPPGAQRWPLALRLGPLHSGLAAPIGNGLQRRLKHAMADGTSAGLLLLDDELVNKARPGRSHRGCQ